MDRFPERNYPEKPVRRAISNAEDNFMQANRTPIALKRLIGALIILVIVDSTMNDSRIIEWASAEISTILSSK